MLSFLVVPNMAPRIFLALNTSSTSVHLKWSPVTSSQLQGAALSSYSVYYKITGGTFHENDKKSVKPEDTEIHISGLNKFCKYTFRVLASTVNGDGIASDPVTVHTDEDSKFVSLIIENRIDR